jgi:hypothetical protein
MHLAARAPVLFRREGEGIDRAMRNAPKPFCLAAWRSAGRIGRVIDAALRYPWGAKDR